MDARIKSGHDGRFFNGTPSPENPGLLLFAEQLPLALP